MEGGRTEVGSQLYQDAEYVSEREPLIGPISATEPEVNNIDVARERFAWTALVRLKPKHFGESESLNPSVSGVSSDICRALKLGGSFFRVHRLASKSLGVQSLGAGSR